MFIAARGGCVRERVVFLFVEEYSVELFIRLDSEDACLFDEIPHSCCEIDGACDEESVAW